MMNVCFQCGMYHADKIIDPTGPFAICPESGYKRPFQQLPLLIVSGASGTGKMTVCQHLLNHVTQAVLLDSDILWRPEFNSTDTNYRDFFELTLLPLSRPVRPLHPNLAPMKQSIRYQGTIIRNDHVLLIKHLEHATGRAYWVLPGGKREPPETEEACVQREMRVETQLDVKVERLLLDEVGIPLGSYKRLKTYLCKIVSGEARPGYEPEIEAAQQYAIAEVRWFDLNNPGPWEAQLESSPFTLPLLQRIRAALGYSV